MSLKERAVGTGFGSGTSRKLGPVTEREVNATEREVRGRRDSHMSI